MSFIKFLGCKTRQWLSIITTDDCIIVIRIIYLAILIAGGSISATISFICYSGNLHLLLIIGPWAISSLLIIYVILGKIGAELGYHRRLSNKIVLTQNMIGLIFLSIGGNYLMQYFKERNDGNSKPKDDFGNNDLKYNLFLVIGLFAYHLLVSIQAVIFLFLLPGYGGKWNRQYKRHRNVINILQEEGSNHSLVAQGNNEFGYEEHPNHEERLLEENQQLNPNEMRVAQFLDFVVEIRQGGIPFNTDLLRRITVEERQNMIASMGTICYYELNEDMYERLIYLPCNQNHVFHEMCILMWFENNRNGPICESVVNQEEVERYARNN